MTPIDAGSEFTPNADELLGYNARFVERFSSSGSALRPRRKLAIVACMDSRMDIFQMLGLAHGDAHIIRNAGGVVTDDVIRSLTVSQRFLDTREVILIHHTNCGLQALAEDTFKAQLEAETGIRPWWALESFSDPFANVRQSIRRLRMNPFVPYKDHIRGFVFDVETGRLHEVEVDDDATADATA